MKSYTNYLTNIPRIINNSLSDNLTWGMEVVNDSIRYLVTKYYFNERSYIVPGGTVTEQQFYNLPPQVKKLINVTVKVGGVLWQPKECPTRQFWDDLNVIQYYQDFPSYFFVVDGQVGIYPTPAADENIVTLNYKTRIKDLITADYTTSTVTLPYSTTFTAVLAEDAVTAELSAVWSLGDGDFQITFSNGDVRQGTFTDADATVTWTDGLSATATATITIRTSQGGDIVTGTATTFAKWMENNWFMVPYAQTNGDQEWYQVDEFYDTTHISLKNTYTGGALAAVTFTIGQVPILPEDYQDLPLYRMGMIYYSTRYNGQDSASKYEKYKELYEDGLAKLDEEFGSKTSNIQLTDTDAPIINPNLFQRNLS